MAHTKISATIPQELLSHVAAEMQATGKSKSAVISDAIRAHFESDEPDRIEDHERRIARLEGMAQL